MNPLSRAARSHNRVSDMPGMVSGMPGTLSGMPGTLSDMLRNGCPIKNGMTVRNAPEYASYAIIALWLARAEPNYR